MWPTKYRLWPLYFWPEEPYPFWPRLPKIYRVVATSQSPQEWTDFEVSFDGQGNVLSFSQVTNLVEGQIYELCLGLPEPFGEGDAWLFGNYGESVEVDPINWAYALEVPFMAWTMTIESKELAGNVIKVAARATDGNIDLEHFMEFTDPAQVTQANIAALMTAYIQTNLAGLQLSQAFNALPVDVPVDLGEIS